MSPKRSDRSIQKRKLGQAVIAMERAKNYIDGVALVYAVDHPKIAYPLMLISLALDETKEALLKHNKDF